MRQRLLRDLQMDRISPEELHEMIVAGRRPFIIDARGKAALAAQPYVIEGALSLTDEELEARQPEIPREQDIVVYCSCPNEISAARLVLKLKRYGIQRVRPLAGGLDAWSARSFPVVARP